jgi:hypothetical protein
LRVIVLIGGADPRLALSDACANWPRKHKADISPITGSVSFVTATLPDAGRDLVCSLAFACVTGIAHQFGIHVTIANSTLGSIPQLRHLIPISGQLLTFYCGAGQ